MSRATEPSTGVQKQMRLPPALAERLTAYAQARGIHEEEAIRRALALLLNEEEPVATSMDDLSAAAAPSDWDVEVPVVVAAQPKSVVRMRAQVVRCRRGTFQPV